MGIINRAGNGGGGGGGVFSEIASQAEAQAGADNTKGMSPLRTAEAIAALGATLPASVSQAEAEAGTEVADRLWSPQRVSQAIAALGGGGGGGGAYTVLQEGSFSTSITEIIFNSAVLGSADTVIIELEDFYSNNPNVIQMHLSADDGATWSGAYSWKSTRFTVDTAAPIHDFYSGSGPGYNTYAAVGRMGRLAVKEMSKTTLVLNGLNRPELYRVGFFSDSYTAYGNSTRYAYTGKCDDYLNINAVKLFGTFEKGRYRVLQPTYS